MLRAKHGPNPLQKPRHPSAAYTWAAQSRMPLRQAGGGWHAGPRWAAQPRALQRQPGGQVPEKAQGRKLPPPPPEGSHQQPPRAAHGLYCTCPARVPPLTDLYCGLKALSVCSLVLTTSAG
jgi:hypothetical protein